MVHKVITQRHYSSYYCKLHILCNNFVYHLRYLCVANIVRVAAIDTDASAGIDAIDVPFLDLDDPEGMKKEAIKAKELGFSGKGSIHPKQIPILNTSDTNSHWGAWRGGIQQGF